MVTKAHSTLTGTDLHEPKGAAAASANTVYVANGTGSGTWQIYQIPLITVWDQKTLGTDGGSFALGAWLTRTLNTVNVNTITGASLASNQITLPAGTYYIDASAPAFNVNFHKTRLYNVTDTALVLAGTSEYATTGVETRSWISGSFTLAGTKALALQHQCTTTQTINGFGRNTGLDVEIYSTVTIWKQA